MNCFVFSGRLARDAEIRHTPNGHAVCAFTVANDVGFGERKTTNWIKCDLWGKRAEGGLPQHLAKGAQVVVSGEVSLDEFEKRDGTKSAALKVRVIDVDLVGGKGERQPQQDAHSEAKANGYAPREAPRAADFDDEIPFNRLPSWPFI